MLKGVVLTVLFVSFCAAGAFAQVPVGTPWDTATLSQADFTGLVEALHTVENLLNDTTMGSRRTLGEDGWTSLSFARYTGGVLSGMGYRVLVASERDGANADHAWVLVLLETSSVSAWIPVEATPSVGQAQFSLGHVAVAATSEATIAFDSRYATSAQTEELPPNVAPIAGLRVSSLFVVVNTPIALFSFLSHDPDGEIVLYRWRIGNGPWSATTSPSASGVPFDEPGLWPVTLQVVDNLGASGVASANIKVNEAGPKPTPDPGCGCG
jgi:hypothetical protein